jgi:hypothetical protein
MSESSVRQYIVQGVSFCEPHGEFDIAAVVIERDTASERLAERHHRICGCPAESVRVRETASKVAG